MEDKVIENLLQQLRVSLSLRQSLDDQTCKVMIDELRALLHSHPVSFQFEILTSLSRKLDAGIPPDTRESSPPNSQALVDEVTDILERTFRSLLVVAEQVTPLGLYQILSPLVKTLEFVARDLLLFTRAQDADVAAARIAVVRENLQQLYKYLDVVAVGQTTMFTSGLVEVPRYDVEEVRSLFRQFEFYDDVAD